MDSSIAMRLRNRRWHTQPHRAGHGIPTKQVFNGDGAECIDASPTGGEVIDRGDLQHRDRLALPLSDDAATIAAGKRRDCQQHLVKLVLDLTQHLGLDWYAVDRASPQTRVIIEKGDDLMVAR